MSHVTIIRGWKPRTSPRCSFCFEDEFYFPVKLIVSFIIFVNDVDQATMGRVIVCIVSAYIRYIYIETC